MERRNGGFPQRIFITKTSIKGTFSVQVATIVSMLVNIDVVISPLVISGDIRKQTLRCQLKKEYPVASLILKRPKTYSAP